MSFPKDFIWGTASASYQIEGAADLDGKGPSIWDTFSHIPGNVYSNQNGDVACDAYHHFEEDLDIMKDLGIKNYRFSISWPRVIPAGTGPVNELGLAYYDKVVDGCLERGIEPWITLFHWDLPQALHDIGGWMNPSIVDAFANYASVIATHFAGRVKRFMTFNEPQCMISLGHVLCVHAPGIRYTPRDTFTCWHKIMLAHGAACKAIRQAVPDALIGVASTGNLCYVNSYDPAYTPSLARSSFLIGPENLPDNYIFFHHWFLDPVILGHYPEDPLHPWTQYAKDITKEDLELLHQPIDFLALNIYNGHEMHIEEDQDPSLPLTYEEKYPGYPRTALKWPVTPGIMYWGPKLLYDRYQLPIVISENGQSCNDRIFLDGKVHDPDRIDFLHRYLLELKKTIEDGTPVIGYLHWSFTDNMEWHSGYDDRFGLVYIDYRDQRRIPKDSAYWYAEVISNNGENL